MCDIEKQNTVKMLTHLQFNATLHHGIWSKSRCDVITEMIDGMVLTRTSP
jgi:lysozyme family protein